MEGGETKIKLTLDKTGQSMTREVVVQSILIKEAEGPKELKLNEKGTFKVTKYSKDEPSKKIKDQIKWAIKIGNDEIKELKDKKGESIEFTPDDKKMEGKEIILMPFLKKYSEEVSCKVSIILEETLIIVGTEQYSKNPANKLMFPGQAVREIRLNLSKHQNLEVLIFKDGYTESQLDAFSNAVLSYNKEARVIQINSVDELINFINGGTRKETKNSIYRKTRKISDIKIYAHGIVKEKTNEGFIAFGLSGKNALTQELGNKKFSEINKDVFLPNKQSHLYSYACRTGIGISNDASVLGDPLKSNSLAQKMSNHANITVHAYMKRSEYQDTWGTQNHRDTYFSDNDKGESKMENLKVDIKDILFSDPKDMKEFSEYILTETKIDGAPWNPKGAYLPVRVGDTPYGPNVSNHYEIFKPE